MALAMCPLCTDDEDVELVEMLEDGRRLVRHRCGYEWTHGQARSTPLTYSFDELRARFPKPEDVDPVWMRRADALKADFLRRQPEQFDGIAEYWARYQQVFSEDGLATCRPRDLKDFANTAIGAHPGNQSVFNSAWNALGDDAAAESTRRTLHYLLHGPAEIPLEDRLNGLLDGTATFAMTGFKESLLTKALCIVHPDRFISILKYTTDAGGKREIARAVYGLELPAPEAVNWTLGRLILWSNDVLNALVGEGFVNQQHASDFLWWAKDQPGGPTDPANAP